MLSLIVAITAGAAPPERADAVRSLNDAYGRVALYIKAGQAFHADQDGVSYRPEDEVRIELRNIQSGPIAEITDSPYGMLVDRPTGYALKIGEAARRLDDGPEHFYYEAQWVLNPFQGGIVEDWFGTTVGEVLRWAAARIVMTPISAMKLR
ncbi:MAG TPA: hypothetical protein VN181_11630 [Thermoanaerobaculia bacterium]|nr:hypothetical protein [Thermoanaerobaculia bacterium]